MPRDADAIVVRPGTDEDVPRVLELMKAALGEDRVPRTERFWSWKHRENPFGPSPLLLAFSGERLIGLRAFMRWRWSCKRGDARAVRAVDTATHPDFQGRGIFKRLTLGLVESMRDEGVNFVFNTPNGSSRPGYLKMGWVSVGRVSLWVLPVRPTAALDLLSKRTRVDDRPSETDADSSDVLRAALETAENHGLVASAPERRGYRTRHDARFLRWRYAECPLRRYACTSSDPQRALVIHRTLRRNGLRELAICELMFERTSSGAAAARESIALAIERARPDYVIAALRPDVAEAAVLMRRGFVPAPRIGPILTVRELAGWNGLPDPRRARNWHASLGDLELF